MRVGAIDIGSNSVRMLVAEWASGAESGPDLVTIARSGESCRLARGLERSGSIEDAMAERAASVAGDFARRARGLGATHLVVGATAALRQAANGAAVAARIAERTGVAVRILSGDEEAQLVYRAVIAGLGARVRSHACVVFDLGGGSTEVVSGVGERAGRWTSLPFGAVSLTDRHLKGDPPGTPEIDALCDEVREAIMHQCAYMPERTPILAGVGGTVTVLASLDRKLSTYDPALLEGWQIPPERLEAHIEQIVQSTSRERGSWPIMGDRKRTRLNSSHSSNSYAVFCLKKKTPRIGAGRRRPHHLRRRRLGRVRGRVPQGVGPCAPRTPAGEAGVRHRDRREHRLAHRSFRVPGRRGVDRPRVAVVPQPQARLGQAARDPVLPAEQRFFFCCSGARRDLHSFPTRRSPI